MCSELLRIPLSWLAISLGGSVTIAHLLVGLLVLVALGLIVWGKKKGRMEEVWGSFPGLLLLAAAIIFLPRFFPEGLPIRGWGAMVLIGSVSGIALAMHRAQQRNLNPEVIISLAFGMFVCGIIGARMFYVIEYWETRFQSDNWKETLSKMFQFTEGGLVVYGSFIGATVAFLWFMRKHRLPILAMADLLAPSLLVGLAIGRIGCLMNGCCYGGESSLPWAVTFPSESMVYGEQVVTGRMYGFEMLVPEGKDNPVVVKVQDGSAAQGIGLQVGMEVVRINDAPLNGMQQELLYAYDQSKSLQLITSEGDQLEVPAPEVRPRSLPVHPTQIYSAVNAGLLAWVLWSFYPYRRYDGEVAALMLTVYPIARFLLEMIRIDESAVFGTGLSISQNISIGLIVGALGLWAFVRRQKHPLAVFSTST